MKTSFTKNCQSFEQLIPEDVPVDLELYFDKVEELTHRMTKKFVYPLQDIFSSVLEKKLVENPKADISQDPIVTALFQGPLNSN